jgi:Tol biopolymer transport system component
MTASADAATGKVTPAPGDIVYSVAADDTTGGDLWLVHSDGTGATQLTISGTVTNPSWSPNGRRIAFVQAGASGS